MESSAISSKQDMYERLSKGEFGNTVPMWFDFWEWKDAPEYYRYDWWGVRSLTPGGPCFLNLPTSWVIAKCNETQQAGHSYNISPMIDIVVNVTLWANIWDSPTGLVVEGIVNPPRGSSWRELMPDPAKYSRWERSAAYAVLKEKLNVGSWCDLWTLLDKYPDHVIELSATEQEFGTIPGRNAVIWEVRKY